MGSWLLPTLLLMAGLGAGCAVDTPQRAQSPEQLSYAELEFQLPQVETVTLANGIRLYLKQDDELPLVQITAMIGSGGVLTPDDKAGFDALFGATWRSGGAGERAPVDLDNELDRLAINVSTSMGPYTSNLKMSLRSVDLAQGVMLLGDFLRRPAFDKARFELARLQQMESVRRQNDNPRAVSRRLLMEALYEGHYLGRSPTLASLKAVDRDDLVSFQRQNFSPNNLWLAVSGDFDRAELLSLLDDSFGDWRRATPSSSGGQPLPARHDALVRVAAKPLPQTAILIGDLGLTKDNPDQYAVRVMNYILGGGGFNSRLMREVRSNRGLAYSVYSYFQVGRRLPGPFIAGAETKNESVVETLSLMRSLMNEMCEKPVSEEELRLARESIVNSFVFGFENPHAVVSRTMSQDFYGYPDDYLVRFRERIAAVTAEDVQRVARKYIRPQEQQIILVGDPTLYRDKLHDALHTAIEDVKLDDEE